METSLYRFRVVFKCDDVIRHTAHALEGLLSNFHRFSVFVWIIGENDSNTLRVEAQFSENGKKKISVFKNIRIRVSGGGQRGGSPGE